MNIMNLKRRSKKTTWVFATSKLIQDSKAAEPNEILLKNSKWDHFV